MYMSKAARNRSGVGGGLYARACSAALIAAAAALSWQGAAQAASKTLRPDPSNIYIFGSGGVMDVRIPGPDDAPPTLNNNDGTLTLKSDDSSTVFRFTPRGLRLPSELSPSSMHPTAFAPEDAEREGSMWLDFSGGAEAPQGVGVSLGAGVTADHGAAGSFASAADANRSTTTFAARLGFQHFSFGGGVRSAAVSTGPAALLSQSEPLGYDLDLSYAFDQGSVTVSRFFGRDDEFLLRPGDRPRERLSLSGKYLVGRGLDFTAALAYSNDTVASGTANQPGNDGWAMLTGVKLNF